MIKKIFSFLLLGMTLTVTPVSAQTYMCDSGWTLQGQTCTKPGVPKTETYTPTCHNGGNLQGNVCVKVTTGPEQKIPAKVIQPAPQPRPPVFICSPGWSLKGSMCSRPIAPISYTASPRCPNGGPVVSGQFCETYNMSTRRIVRTPAAQPCPRGGALSGRMCVIPGRTETTPATVRY